MELELLIMIARFYQYALLLYEMTLSLRLAQISPSVGIPQIQHIVCLGMVTVEKSRL